MKKLSPKKSYVILINELKIQIQAARTKASLAVNRELILLYFKIGKLILEKQAAEGWGSKIVERISNDLRNEFPEMKGLSVTNLFYMRKFAETYGIQICQQLGGELKISPFFDIPWRHHVMLMD
jgi:predicted nuclease of restriction endonuclease-like (RecB) superfamily